MSFYVIKNNIQLFIPYLTQPTKTEKRYKNRTPGLLKDIKHSLTSICC